MDRFDENLSFEKIIPGEYAYFGPIYNHFGHMMAECVHRAVPSKMLAPRRKFILVGASGDTANDYGGQPQFIKDILLFFELEKSDVLFLNDNSVVENLFICEQGSDFGGGPKKGYLEYLDAYTKPRLQKIAPTVPLHDKVYVSRSKLPPGGGILGESYIECILENDNFFIFNPQEYSLFDQMHLYESARILIFSEGSACHGVELFGNRALNQCCVIERRPDHRDIFRRILQPRAQQFSSLHGAYPVASIVLHPETGTLLSHLGVVLLNHTQLTEYLQKNDITTLPGFSRHSYHEAVRKDFMIYVSYHKKNGSRIVTDTELRLMEQHMNRLLHAL